MLVVLLKKADYNNKVTEIENKLNNHNHDKYITTPKFNTLAVHFSNAKLSQANLVTKRNFDNTISSLDSKIAMNKKWNKFIENKLRTLKTFDLGYFIGKIHFEEDGVQNYLALQPICRYFEIIANKKIYFIMEI